MSNETYKNHKIEIKHSTEDRVWLKVSGEKVNIEPNCLKDSLSETIESIKNEIDNKTPKLVFTESYKNHEINVFENYDFDEFENYYEISIKGEILTDETFYRSKDYFRIVNRYEERVDEIEKNINESRKKVLKEFEYFARYLLPNQISSDPEIINFETAKIAAKLAEISLNLQKNN